MADTYLFGAVKLKRTFRSVPLELFVIMNLMITGWIQWCIRQSWQCKPWLILTICPLSPGYPICPWKYKKIKLRVCLCLPLLTPTTYKNALMAENALNWAKCIYIYIYIYLYKNAYKCDLLTLCVEERPYKYIIVDTLLPLRPGIPGWPCWPALPASPALPWNGINIQFHVVSQHNSTWN